VATEKEWTPERTAALIALWDEELSTAEIGRRLGVTKNAVIGKANRLDLPQRRPTTGNGEEHHSNGSPCESPLIMLDNSQCSWPIGNPGEEEFHFCGAPAVPGKPYCKPHCDVAYVRRGCTEEKEEDANADPDTWRELHVGDRAFCTEVRRRVSIVRMGSSAEQTAVVRRRSDGPNVYVRCDSLRPVGTRR
jgi:GcrA cell cycle regulator